MRRWIGNFFPHSLKLRLMAAAALWVLPVLALAGFLLGWAFRTHLESQLDGKLADYQRELLAAASIDAAGNLVLDYMPADPRFSRVFSGWYWQAAIDGKVVRQSTSAGPMGAGALGLLSPEGGITELYGPGERELRVYRRDVTLPGSSGPVAIVVAAPCDELEADMAQFATHIVVIMATLGLTFLFAIYLQVGFGLRPLSYLRREIAAIRNGRAEHLSSTFPDEIAPVVAEVNALIDHNRQLIDRARNEAGNLAHALKNPLSVLSHEIAALEPERRAVLSAQIDSISGQVERILHRIRTAGPSAGNTRVELSEIADDLTFSLGTIYRERRLDLRFEIAPGAVFAGDRGDLVEILGNLCDNACKWARSRVTVHASPQGGRLALAVEDDGPGIAAKERETVLARGQRLDERVPGSGLGLDIVREIVTLYRGQLNLSDSTLGGLRVELDLPAA
ncbi:ATP-binding protein [Dongia rigui]|uniref:histidine kinase n=1 Tax=Dongia rigui TaxID=940149 RepID=A0ABU5E697_9PROT|nr:ATP-binding protein [Dongia rigui]MDY0874488.1 ATP-binding protein [Dongia rigui]